MPNRILKESICYSESINALTWFEECLFYRLIVNADDYGRIDARPAMLKARLFPLRSVTEKTIGEAVNRLSTAGMVRVYTYDRQPFLQLAAWNSHQQIRAKRSKYPAPGETPDRAKKDGISSDINGNHMISDDIICSRNPIQAESEYVSEAEAETRARARKASAAAAADTHGESVGDGEMLKDAEAELETVVRLFRENIHIPTPLEEEQLGEFTAMTCGEAVLYAIREAVAQDKRSIGYIQAIVRRLCENGVRCKADLEARILDWRQKKAGGAQPPLNRKTPGIIGGAAGRPVKKQLDGLRYTQRACDADTLNSMCDDITREFLDMAGRE